MRAGPLALYRMVWLFAFAVALLSNSWFYYLTELRDQAADRKILSAGIDVRRDGEDVHVFPMTDAAIRAGIAPFDRLVAIDGRPLAPTDTGALSTRFFRPDGSIVTVDLIEPGHAPYRVTLSYRAANVEAAYAGTYLSFAARHWLAFWGYGICNGFMLAAAGLLYLRRPRDPVAALISFGLILNNFYLYRIFPETPPMVKSVTDAINWAFTLAGIAYFPDGRATRRWTALTLAVAAVATVLAILAFTLGGLFAYAIAVAFPIALAIGAGCMVARYRATLAGMQRQQIKFVLFGAVVTVIAVTLFVAAEMTSNLSGGHMRILMLTARNFFNAVSGIGLSAGLLFALMRYRLYDADAVISRSAAYAFLTLLVGAVFAGSEKVIEVLGEEFFGESMRAVSAGLGAAVAATLVGPLHNRVHRWTEQRFQKALAALREDLPKLVGDMREFAGLDHLLATIVTRIERGVRATRAAVLLRDEQGFDLVRAQDIAEADIADWRRGWQPRAGAGLDCDRDDGLFPIRLPLYADGAGTIGWILLGPRPDGSFYGKDEREALAEVADPVARAIHIVRQRDAREAERDARQALLERRLAALEQRPAPGPSAA